MWSAAVLCTICDKVTVFLFFSWNISQNLSQVWITFSRKKSHDKAFNRSEMGCIMVNLYCIHENCKLGGCGAGEGKSWPVCKIDKKKCKNCPFPAALFELSTVYMWGQAFSADQQIICGVGPLLTFEVTTLTAVQMSLWTWGRSLHSAAGWWIVVMAIRNKKQIQTQIEEITGEF